MNRIVATHAVFVLIVVAGTNGCASMSTAHPRLDANRTNGSSGDVITTAELGRLNPGLPVLDAIEHARPWFLHSRGSVSLVSIDYSPPTGPSALRMIPVGEVKEIRFLRAGWSGLAGIRPDGTVAVGDVVLVVTAKGQP